MERIQGFHALKAVSERQRLTLEQNSLGSGLDLQAPEPLVCPHVMVRLPLEQDL